MANRFTRDSSAELWTHLEALSREGVRWFATTAARDAEFTAPVAGMTCHTGTGAAMVKWVHNGTSWKGQLLDSGWLDITPAAGFAPVAAAEPKIRVRNGVTRFKGSLRGTLAAGVASLIGTVPAAGRPADVWETAVPTIETTGRTLVYTYVDPAGVITAIPVAATNPGTVSLVPLGGYLVEL